MGIIDDAQKAMLEEVAKQAAAVVVQEQAPSRKAEHESIALRVIRFTLWLTVFEIAVITSAFYYDRITTNKRIDCLSSRTTNLVYEHIGKNGFKPLATCP